MHKFAVVAIAAMITCFSGINMAVGADEVRTDRVESGAHLEVGVIDLRDAEVLETVTFIDGIGLEFYSFASVEDAVVFRCRSIKLGAHDYYADSEFILSKKTLMHAVERGVITDSVGEILDILARTDERVMDPENLVRTLGLRDLFAESMFLTCSEAQMLVGAYILERFFQVYAQGDTSPEGDEVFAKIFEIVDMVHNNSIDANSYGITSAFPPIPARYPVPYPRVINCEP